MTHTTATAICACVSQPNVTVSHNLHMMTRLTYNRLRLNEDEKHENINRSKPPARPAICWLAIDALKNVSALQISLSLNNLLMQIL